MTDETGEITIVTGGSRGIGAAIVLALAGSGRDVAFTYREDAAAAEDVQRRATGAGGRCTAVQADVTDPEQVRHVFAESATRGVVTGVVNNAGVTAHIGELADTPVETIRAVIDINLFGTVLCAREAVRSMARSRGGRGGAIVNISSAAATLGSPHEYVHYAAAKAGVDALTIGLAKEVAGEGIRVNAVAPGIVDTEIHAAAGDPGRAQRAAARIPAGRAAQPSEISSAIVWLLSPEASYTTGAILRVAGGI